MVVVTLKRCFFQEENDLRKLQCVVPSVVLADAIIVLQPVMNVSVGCTREIGGMASAGLDRYINSGVFRVSRLFRHEGREDCG